ncbi:MAG TPA: chromosome segregation protein SMC [Nitrospiria bacterium]|jgi:chromosome segregation protein|nr:chromosome segregation protein SMC [Nitrospiria bacterium]
MFLKKLELIGFKSFAESMVVTFQPGITAIVGPNGCGKSNIVDAVLWVLGEQSTKALRSDRMEDVIFNGSETRRPLNLSQVILTVGDVTGEIAGQFGDYQEIAISRRLFRTGESEYLINKTPCRLKDIRDLLIDTGAGHKGHTIIEQGKVDQLLNASPLERRELIEETAGISKYKLRKAEAERKLEATQQNLLRVRDIIGEVKRQINALDRQVKKTELYQELRTETRGLELKLLVSEYRDHRTTLSEVLRQMAELKTDESALLAELSRTEAELQAVKTGALQKETALSSLKQAVYDTQTLIHRQENRIELLRHQIHSWEEQRSKLGQEQTRLEQSLTLSVAQGEETERQLSDVVTILSDRRERLTIQETALAEVETQRAVQDAGLEENKTRLFETMAEMTEVKNRVASLESRKKEIQRIQDKGRSELSSVDQQIDQTRQALEAEQSRLNDFLDTLNRVQAEGARLGDEVHQKQGAIATRTEAILGQREVLTLAQARLASLKENEKAMMTTQAGILAWLSERPELRNRLHGIVADLLEVPKAFEPAIEAALGDQLQGLLIDDHATIKEIVQSLKSVQLGRGVFLPRTPRQTRTAQVHSSGEEFDGFIGPALQQIKVRSGFEAAAQALLGDVLLVRDLESALKLWSQLRIGYTIVTLEGEVLSPSGLLWAGRRTGSQQGLLLTRREIREAEEQLIQLESDLGRSETDKAALASDLERLQQRQLELIEQRQLEEATIAAQRQKIALLEADRLRLEERRGLLQTEHAQEAQEVVTAEQALAEALLRLEAQREEQGRIENELARLQETAKNFSERQDLLRSEVTQLKVDVSALVQREEALSKEKLRRREDQASLTEQQHRQATEITTLESKGLAARQDIEQTEKTIGTLSAQLSETQQRLSVETESYMADLGQINQLENRLGQVRAERARAEKLHNELDMRQTELKLRIEHLVDQASSLHQTVLEDAAEAMTEPINPAPVQERLSELRAKLDQLGPVNLAAIDEYRELDERYRFLTTQETDLTQSIEDLESAISKINRTTKEMFFSTYSALREKFKEVFQNFFVGGQADLVLLDENNPLESGIEIVAQPPGKRLKSISLLSGGEKALTAIALLFASFLIHPSPFCILDEIDAPLDEENIRRFLKVLRQMTDHSQFLIITHNKRTMEQADLLYGVTMEEAGVSKLVSIKLGANGNGHTVLDPASVTAESSTTATA